MRSPAVRVRPFEPGDAPRVRQISDLLFPLRARVVGGFEEQAAAGEAMTPEHARLVAAADSGVVGWGQVTRTGRALHPGRFTLNILVDPAAQRRGVGGTLFRRLLDELSSRGGRVLRASAQESRPDAVAFLVNRGFVEVNRLWESRLDVAAFDCSRFEAAGEHLPAAGIEITTLEEELARGDREHVLRRLHDLDLECYEDVPVAGGIPRRSYEEFLRHGPQAPGVLPGAWFLAKAGDTYVGESCVLQHGAEPEVLRQRFTGVRRAFRGKGIALALKLETIRYALEHGKRVITTGNHARNEAMLRVNEQLGFVRQPVHITFEKTLP